MENYMTAKEAADKLGYEYTHFTRLLKQGKVPGAFRWEGYAVPNDISRDDIDVRRAGRPSEGYVYLIEGNGWHKIGCAKDPDARAEWFDVRLPFKVQLIHLIKSDDCHKLERDLHSRFKDKRLNGEWFNLSPKDVEEIQQIK